MVKIQVLLEVERGGGVPLPLPTSRVPTEKYGGVLNSIYNEVPVYRSLSQIWQQIL
jgi:hypothetical protein